MNFHRESLLQSQAAWAQLLHYSESRKTFIMSRDDLSATPKSHTFRNIFFLLLAGHHIWIFTDHCCGVWLQHSSAHASISLFSIHNCAWWTWGSLDRKRGKKPVLGLTTSSVEKSCPSDLRLWYRFGIRLQNNESQFWLAAWECGKKGWWEPN